MTVPMEPSNETLFKYIANREYFEYEGRLYQKTIPLQLIGITNKVNAITNCDNGYYLRWFDDNTKVIVEMGKGI